VTYLTNTSLETAKRLHGIYLGLWWEHEIAASTARKAGDDESEVYHRAMCIRADRHIDVLKETIARLEPPKEPELFLRTRERNALRRQLEQAERGEAVTL
jgi:hypothetical protein